LTQVLQDTGGCTAAAARKETAASIDRLVSLAGWCDKLDQVLGCRNAVAGPYHNHTMPQPRGVIGVFTPPKPGLLGLVTMVGAALVPGNAVVAVVPLEAALPAVLRGEMRGVSDVPAGAVNLLTGHVEELLEPLGGHGAVHGLLGAGLDRSARTILRRAAADSVLRPVECLDFDEDAWFDDARACSPWFLDRLVDFKTIWHPSSPPSAC
jgi:acyl-CoA reductase-like NAD-dependent aldehyde dehydrogenase